MKTYASFDGTTISYHELGEGPVVILLHGFSGNADLNWFQPRIAQKVPDAGHPPITPGGERIPQNQYRTSGANSPTGVAANSDW